MADRVALVTGASSGIGYAIAETLGAEGFGLTVTSRRAEHLLPAADSLRSKGYEVHDALGDVLEAEDIARIVNEHASAWGRLDVLVNSAGGGIMAPVGSLDDRITDRQLGLNLRSTILFVHRCLPLLQKTGSPLAPVLILNVSSLAGKQEAPGLSIYAAAKHGLVGYTASLNAELAGSGIHATVLCPEIVATPLTDFPAFEELMSKEQMITVGDVCEAVRFLLRLSPACVVPELIFRNSCNMGT
jgi:NAD(P)-dependent dehydrogenase (short-subunit alcohol dehydrogenase family)